MKKAKLIKTNKKEKKIIENDSYSLKNFLYIILILVIVFGIFYFITTMVIEPVTEENNKMNAVTEIDSTKITLNNLLNRKESEYYVLATKKRDNDNVNYLQLYNNYIQNYTTKENSLTFYNVDLSDALNKNYIDEKLNISNELRELRLNDDILFKIKDNRIAEYFSGSKDIIEALSKL